MISKGQMTNRIRGTPMGAHFRIGSLPPGAAFGPYPGLFASYFACPQESEGESCLRVLDHRRQAQTATRWRGRADQNELAPSGTAVTSKLQPPPQLKTRRAWVACF